MASKATIAKYDGTQTMLRKVAIGAAAVGVLLDIISLVYCRTKRGQHSMVAVTGVAFLPLGLSFIWNNLVLFPLSRMKNRMVEAMLVLADVAFFLGFLAISIANGVVMKGLEFSSRYAYRDQRSGIYRSYTRPGLEADHVELYTYNSVPWLICATLHLLAAGLVLQRVLELGFGPKADATCPDCQRKWHRGDARSKDGAETSLLAAHDYDEDADGA
ncbi:MAG: hypothetical protein Q9169_003946 [Polycauliona sp. 2 TL-2023]